MALYYNPIVEVLEKNIGIKKCDLYNKSGLTAREFITQLNRLIAEYRIDVDDYKYYPRMLWLYEFSNEYELETNRWLLNYLPIEELEKGLEYVNLGTEQEDCLDFELQIARFYLKEKDKAFIEKHNNLNLNFRKFYYELKVEYKESQILTGKEEEYGIHLVYIDNDKDYADRFMKMISDKYITNCIWHYFSDTISAFGFIENAIEENLRLKAIITENNASIDGIEFIQAIREFEIEMENRYIGFYIPTIAFTNGEILFPFEKYFKSGEVQYLHIKKSIDEYIIGNTIINL